MNCVSRCRHRVAFTIQDLDAGDSNAVRDVVAFFDKLPNDVAANGVKVTDNVMASNSFDPEAHKATKTFTPGVSGRRASRC